MKISIIQIFLSLFLCFIYHEKIFSQGIESDGDVLVGNYIQKIVPSSPTASALSLSAKVNVNNYTGTPNINIPIYDLKSKTLGIPISLNYHSAGHKVEDIASWVGLGWSLNAGGAIVREMRGLPDDKTNIGYLSTGNEIHRFDQLSSGDKGTWIHRSNENSHDTEPDVFYFSFAGRSGKFVFDHTGTIRQIPHQTFNIKYNRINTTGKIVRFEVIDESGVRYIFGKEPSAIEETEYQTLEIPIRYRVKSEVVSSVGLGDILTYKGSHSPNIYPIQTPKKIDYFNSTWYLSEIISPNGDQMTFNYTEVGECKYIGTPKVSHISPHLSQLAISSYYNNFGTILTKELCNTFVRTNATKINEGDKPLPYRVAADRAFEVYLCKTECDYYCSNFYTSTPSEEAVDAYNIGGLDGGYWSMEYARYGEYISVNQSKRSVKVKRLESIEAKYGSRVEFKVLQERPDAPGDVRLDEILVYNRNNKLIKNFGMGYEVYTSSQWDDINLNNPLAFHEGLMLKNLIGPGVNTKLKANQIWNYSSQIDNLNLNSYLKEYVLEGLKEYHYKRLFLTKVTEYVKPSTSSDKEFDNNLVHTISYDQPEKLPRRTSLMVGKWGYYRNSFSKRFFDSKQNYQFEVIDGFPGDIPLSERGDVPDQNGNALIGAIKSIKYPLGGTTEFIFEGHEFGAQDRPGLRIKEIIDYEDKENNIIANKSRYVYSTPQLLSYTKPNFISYIKLRSQDNSYFHNVVRTSFNQVQPNLIQGSIAGYQQVSIKKYNANNSYLGKEVYNYKSNLEIAPNKPSTYFFPKARIYDGTENYVETTRIDNKNIYPFAPFIYFDYTGGLLETISIYSNTEKLIKSTEYRYKFNPEEHFENIDIHGLKGFTIDSYYISDNDKTDYTKYIGGIYKYTSRWMYPEEIIEKTFDNGIDSQAFETSTFNIYSKEHLQLSELHQKDSKGNDIITRYKYPQDYLIEDVQDECDIAFESCINSCAAPCQQVDNNDDCNACINACTTNYQNCKENKTIEDTDAVIAIKYMQNNHMISLPLETIILKKNNTEEKIIGGSINTYKLFHNSVQPHEKYKLELQSPIDANLFGFSSLVNTSASTYKFNKDSRYRRQVEFLDYDPDGNLREYKEENNIPVSFIWGYDYTYPIAKIIGAGYQEVVQSLLPTSIADIQNLTDADLKNTISSINNILSDIDLTFYTYDPQVGMTSSTDSSGRTTYYFYDTMGRLQYMKDYQGNIIQKYEYHYKE